MKEPQKKKGKLFGVSHPLGKAIICIVFVVLTGGLGLIVLLLGMVGDYFASKKLERSEP